MEEKDINIDEFFSSFVTLKFSIIKEIKTLRIYLNRPKQLNAINYQMFSEFKKIFSSIGLILKNIDIRVIILTGSDKSFCVGLDLFSDIAQKIVNVNHNSDIDIGRKSYQVYELIKYLQDTISCFDECPIPIIAGIHGYCLGGGINIISCVDYKIGTRDSKYSIKEVDIGLTADLGILQRLAKQIGNESIVKKLSFTGEIFSGEIAYKYNIINELVENELQLENALIGLAQKISEKSPLVLWGIKRMINFSRENNTKTSLDMVATLNSSLIQSNDISDSIQGVINKKKVIYPKL